MRRKLFFSLGIAGFLSILAKAETIIPMHNGGIWDIDVSRDGNTIATAGGDGMIKLWDLKSFTNKHAMKQNQNKFQLYDVTFFPDGKRIIATQLAGFASVWDTNGNRLADLDAHKEMVVRTAVSDDGRLIYTAGADDTVMAWDSATYQAKGKISFKSPVAVVPQKNTGEVLITGLAGVLIADVVKDEVLLPISRIERFSAAVKASDNVTFLSGALTNHAAPHLLNPKGDITETLKQIGDGWGWNIAASAATADHGVRVAVAYYQGPTVVWDLSSKDIIFQTTTETWQSLSVAFSPLGNQVYIGDTNGNLRVFDLKL